MRTSAVSVRPSSPVVLAVKVRTLPWLGAGTPSVQFSCEPDPLSVAWFHAGPGCHEPVAAFHHGPAAPFICTATPTDATGAEPAVAVPAATTGSVPGFGITEPEAGEVMEVDGAVPLAPPSARSYRKPSLEPMIRLPAESAAELIT